MKSPEPTVAAVVRQQTGIAWSLARRLCTEGRVTVNGERCLDPASRVAPGTVFLPFHFAGWYQGRDLLDKYPEGAAPVVRGEAVNTAMTYGYDSVTMMQETKTTLCQIEKFQG